MFLPFGKEVTALLVRFNDSRFTKVVKSPSGKRSIELNSKFNFVIRWVCPANWSIGIDVASSLSKIQVKIRNIRQ